MDKQDNKSWAQEELGSAKLGHKRKIESLVRVGALIAAKPAARVTEISGESAEREAIYRLLENNDLNPAEITAAAGRAALGRIRNGSEYAVVAVDGTSLRIVDRLKNKGFGQVGMSAKSRGVQVQTALLLDRFGTALGVLAQQLWNRPDKRKKKTRSKTDRRPLEEKETAYWLKVLDDCVQRQREVMPGLRLWYQMDRGYDCWPILQRMSETDALFTVRSAYNRALFRKEEEAEGDDDSYLHEALSSAEVIDTIELDVTKSRARTARRARLSLRATTVTIQLKDPSGEYSKTSWPVNLSVVQLQEEGTTPKGEKPLCWTLWTNRKVETAEDAKLVVDNYALRWRIEEFHRVWKSGALRVEESQLRAPDHFERLARIGASVACRILRLTHLARTSPHKPAENEFAPDEVQALKVMAIRQKKDKEPLTMALAVLVLATAGGYTGKSSGGPPGPLVLTRGYHKLQQAIEILAIIKAVGIPE